MNNIIPICIPTMKTSKWICTIKKVVSYSPTHNSYSVLSANSFDGIVSLLNKPDPPSSLNPIMEAKVPVSCISIS